MEESLSQTFFEIISSTVESKNTSYKVTMKTSDGVCLIAIQDDEICSEISMQESIKKPELNIKEINIADGVSSVMFNILFTLASYRTISQLINQPPSESDERLLNAINFTGINVTFGKSANMENVLNTVDYRTSQTEEILSTLELAKAFVGGFEDGILELKPLEGTQDEFMKLYSGMRLDQNQLGTFLKNICDESYVRENMFVIKCIFPKIVKEVTFFIAEISHGISSYVLQTGGSTNKDSEEHFHVHGLLRWVELARFMSKRRKFVLRLQPLTVPIKWYESSVLMSIFEPSRITPASDLCKQMRSLVKNSETSVKLTRKSKTLSTITAAFQGNFICDMTATNGLSNLLLTKITMVTLNVSKVSLTTEYGTMCAWLALAVGLCDKRVFEDLSILGTKNTLHGDLTPTILALNGFQETKDRWVYSKKGLHLQDAYSASIIKNKKKGNAVQIKSVLRDVTKIENDVLTSFDIGETQTFLWNATLPEQPTSQRSTIHDLFLRRLSFVKSLIPGFKDAKDVIKKTDDSNMMCSQFIFKDDTQYAEKVEIFSRPGIPEGTVEWSWASSKGRTGDNFSHLNFLRRSLLPLIIIAYFSTYGLTRLEAKPRSEEIQWYAKSGFKDASGHNAKIGTQKWYLQKRLPPKQEFSLLDLTDTQLNDLNGDNFVNDNVINAYLLTVTANLPGVVTVNTFFADGGMKNYFARLLLAPVVLFPVHVDGNHWIAGYLDRRKKVLSMYDPYHPSAFASTTSEFIQKFKKKMYEHVLPNEISTEYADGPQQKDGYNCAIFSCQWLKCRANGVEPSFSNDKATMRSFRNEMRDTLVVYRTWSASVPSVTTGTESLIDHELIGESESKIADTETLASLSRSKSIPGRKNPRKPNAKSVQKKLSTPLLNPVVTEHKTVVHDPETRPRVQKLVKVGRIRKLSILADGKPGGVSKGFPQAWL